MKKIFRGLGLGLFALVLVFGVGAGSANATLTLGALTVDSSAALNLGTSTATSAVIGSVLTTSLTVTTDGTGTAEVVLPTGAISTGEILDDTVGVSDLAASLAFADADLVSFASVSVSSATEGLILPQHATDCSTAGTAEGQVCWEADANILYIGDGTTVTQAIGNASGNNTWTGTNAFNGATLGIGNAVTDNLTVTSAIQGATPLVFDGLTDDTNELTLAVPDVGGDITITLPSAAGTLATLAGTETLSGKTLTAPKFADGGFIADAAGLTMLSFDSAATAVNYLEVTNSATGVNLGFLAKGTDTDISISYNSKGAGTHRFQEQSATGDVIAIDPQETSAASFTGTIASADLTGSNKTWTFPDATGNIALDTGGATSGNVLLETEIDASTELIALMDDETGTGALVFANTPTLVTPVLGAATATSVAIGGGTAVTKVEKATTAAIDLGDLVAAGCSVATSNVIADAALGDTVSVSPLLDDAAWDTGSLTAFVESAGVIKITYCAPASGAPASMTYNLALTKF